MAILVGFATALSAHAANVRCEAVFEAEGSLLALAKLRLGADAAQASGDRLSAQAFYSAYKQLRTQLGLSEESGRRLEELLAAERQSTQSEALVRQEKIEAALARDENAMRFTLPLHQSTAFSLPETVALSADGERMAAVEIAKNTRFPIVVREIKTGRQLAAFDPRDAKMAFASSLEFSPDGRTLIAAYGNGNQARVLEIPLDRQAPAKERRLEYQDAPDTSISIGSMRLNAAGELAYVLTEKQFLIFRDSSFKGVHIPTPHGDYPLRVELSRDHARVAVVGIDGKPVLWRLPARQGVFSRFLPAKPIAIELEGGEASFKSLAFDQTSTAVIGAKTSANGAVIWDAATGKKRLELPTDEPVLCAIFSADGREALLGFSDGAVERRNAVTGETIAVTAGPLPSGNPVSADELYTSVDGRTLLTRGSDGRLQVWGSP